MLSIKNQTPKQISFLAALMISAPCSLLIWILERKPLLALAVLGFLLCFTFILILYLINRFVYRKIKLIYKFIYNTKASKKQETYYKYILPKKSIGEVEQDVERWAVESKAEIENLRTNEQFRKEFLQNLSHEFKTPVFAIQGYIDLLLDGEMENPEINRNFLEKASKNVQRLGNLINDLDEISKLERGELKLIKQNFVMQDLIKEVYEGLSFLAEDKSISLAIKKGCELPITVFADKEKIHQILVNLVKNSIKYGKKYGNITASIYNTDGENILIEISDDGIGIEEGSLPRIFERFYRTKEGRSIDVTGTGLGLAICKHIIEAHGKNIHIRSTLDVGTTVGFTLPKKAE